MSRPIRFRSILMLAAGLIVLFSLWPGMATGAQAASLITLRSTASATNGTGSASLAVPKPTGIQSGDVLLAQVAVHSATTAITPPSGWHLIRSLHTDALLEQATFYKAATASEPASYTWSFGTSQPASGAVVSLVGVNTAHPIDASSGKYSISTATASFTQVTTTTPNDLLVAFVSVAGNTAITPPSGFAESYDLNDSVSGNGKTAEMSRAVKTIAGLSTVPNAREDTLAASNLTQLIALRPAPTDITVAVVGDMHCQTLTCQDAHTADIVAQMKPNVFLALGDLVSNGAYSNFVNYYDPLWGPFRSFTRPVPGNHEGDETGYFDYWNGIGIQNGIAGVRGKGWYSFNLGGWHFVALNSNCVWDDPRVNCQPGSEEIAWLTADLDASTSACTIAFMHHPYYTSGDHQYPELQTIFQTLYDHKVELYFAGHAHYYQRFYPQDAYSNRDDANGVTEIGVGTGGGPLANVSSTATAKNEAAQIGQEFGVLKLVLHAKSYDYQFLPAAGFTATDSGSGTCH